MSHAFKLHFTLDFIVWNAHVALTYYECCNAASHFVRTYVRRSTCGLGFASVRKGNGWSVLKMDEIHADTLFHTHARTHTQECYVKYDQIASNLNLVTKCCMFVLIKFRWSFVLISYRLLSTSSIYTCLYHSKFGDFSSIEIVW